MSKIKQKTILKDREERLFKDFNSLMEFLKNQNAESIWKCCYISEIETRPIMNCELNMKNIRQDQKISENCPDDAIKDCMKKMKLALSFPYETMECYPLSDIAYASLSERAGVGGRSISTFEDNGRLNEMAPENKSDIFNYCFPLYKNAKCLVLLRDNKVLAVLSGDSNDYSILEANRLLDTLNCNLALEFPNYQFKEATVSQEYVVAKFMLHDQDSENRYLDIVHKFGLHDITTAKAEVLFVTSDVGLSAAKIIPMINTNQGTFPIGKAISLSHKNNATISKFDDLCSMIMSLYKDSIENVENLAKTRIKHSAGCLRAIAFYLGLPRKASLIVAENLTGEMTAYHIFYYLNEIMAEHERQKPMNIKAKLRMQEDIAKAIFLRFSEFDHPFEWSK